jgi:hypothetical protein
LRASSTGAVLRLHPLCLQVPQQAFERRFAPGIEALPAFGLQHEEALGPVPRRCAQRTEEARAAAIASRALGDLDGNLPHILDRAGVHAVRAHAGRLPLAAVDGALRRLQRNIAAVACRADDRASHLRADGGRHHAGANRGC